MNHFVIRAALAICLSVAASSAFSQTPGLDCANAATGVERTICGKPTLAALDARMGTYYALLLGARPVEAGMAYREFRDALRNQQASWLTQVRDACGRRAACLETAYRNRIAALSNTAHQHLGLTFAAASVGDAQTGDAGDAAQRRVDYTNASFRIDDRVLTLVGGTHSEPSAPGSAAQHVTKVVATPAFGVLAGKRAAAVFIVDQPGGSGSFVYAGVTFGDGDATVPAVLGDRIVPQSITFQGDTVRVRYLDRMPDEPMFKPPSVAKLMILRFDSARRALVEVKPR